MQGLIPSNFLQEIGEQSEGTGPGRIQENRGTVRPIPRDRNRGHGPGARGPPPPPRDGMPPRGDVRERRKGTLHVSFLNFFTFIFIYKIFLSKFGITMYRFFG